MENGPLAEHMKHALHGHLKNFRHCHSFGPNATLHLLPEAGAQRTL